jgi:hypothetical protein
MTMLGAVTVTNANGAVIATGDGNYEYDPTIQVANVQDNGLQSGAVYTLTCGDGTGWQGLVYVNTDGNIANFDNSMAQAF